jgi:hypothetical protein
MCSSLINWQGVVDHFITFSHYTEIDYSVAQTLLAAVF